MVQAFMSRLAHVYTCRSSPDSESHAQQAVTVWRVTFIRNCSVEMLASWVIGVVLCLAAAATVSLGLNLQK